METVLQNNTLSFVENWKTSSLKINEESVKEAHSYLNENSFPTTKNEAWKYTRLAQLAKGNFQLLEARPLKSSTLFNGEETLSFEFSNGHLLNSLENLPAGLQVNSMKDASQIKADFLSDNDFFARMNLAYAQDGLEIRVAKNTKINQPIVVQLGSQNGAASLIHNQVIMEEGSDATIVWIADSNCEEGSFTHMLNHFEVQKNARLTVYKIQNTDNQSFVINSDYSKQDRDSYFHIHTSTFGGKIVRNDLNCKVEGENSNTHLNGMYLGTGNMHFDNHTIVDHIAANCESNELYKGVMNDSSTAVFNGKVFVRKDAQKINAFQSNGNVLLSDDATINSKPELEIYADDVKCSHGSTTGQLDEEAVFYLRSRGLTDKSARMLLVSAFVGDVIDKVDCQSVQKALAHILKEKFDWDF